MGKRMHDARLRLPCYAVCSTACVPQTVDNMVVCEQFDKVVDKKVLKQ